MCRACQHDPRFGPVSLALFQRVTIAVDREETFSNGLLVLVRLAIATMPRQPLPRWRYTYTWPHRNGGRPTPNDIAMSPFRRLSRKEFNLPTDKSKTINRASRSPGENSTSEKTLDDDATLLNPNRDSHRHCHRRGWWRTWEWSRFSRDKLHVAGIQGTRVWRCPGPPRFRRRWESIDLDLCSSKGDRLTDNKYDFGIRQRIYGFHGRSW